MLSTLSQLATRLTWALVRMAPAIGNSFKGRTFVASADSRGMSLRSLNVTMTWCVGAVSRRDCRSLEMMASAWTEAEKASAAAIATPKVEGESWLVRRED